MPYALCTRDVTTHCPSCGTQNSDYSEIPEPVLLYTRDDEGEKVEVRDSFPDLRDYKCRNCDHTWLMSKPEEF